MGGDVGNGSLRTLRQQHGDPVAAGQAVRRQHVGEPVRQAADVGEAEPLQIVCGAANVRPGLKIPASVIGAVLPGD